MNKEDKIHKNTYINLISLQRTDAEIYAQLVAGSEESDHYYRGCLKTMLGEPQEEGLFNQTQIKEYIGASFREKVRHLVPGRVQFQSVSFFSYYSVKP